MKKGILAIGLALVIFGGAFYVVQDSNKKAQNSQAAEKTDNQNKTNTSSSDNSKTPLDESAVKIKAKDFKLKDLNGKEIALSSLKGKNVYINFWATWCGPCKAEMPELEKLYKETKDSDLVILAVNVGDSSEVVKAFMDANKYTFNVLLDTTAVTSNNYDVSGIPTSFFIDKEGNLISKQVGAMSVKQMKEEISKLK